MRRPLLLFVYGALALAVALLGAYLAVALLVERAPEVKVPAVVGLSLSEGLDALAAAELDLEVRGFLYDDAVAENHIVRQRPEEGQIVKAGRAVGVVLSRGPERHPVPDVRGISLEDARILLEEAGLLPDVAVRLPRGPRAEVVAQGVEPGVPLPRDSKVPLVVSSGPRPVLLRSPRLEGRSLEDALTLLDDLGLRLGRVEEVRLDDPERQGKVVGQEPLAGFPVQRGSSVVLSVAGAASLGPPSRALWISRNLSPGFSRRRVELIVDGGARSWVLADEWLPGGDTFQRWVPLRSGEAVRLRIDGEEVTAVH